MMHSYTLFAALAMAVAVKASPIAQADAPDAAAGINIQAAAVESASAEATAAASGDVLGEDVPPATDLGEIDGVDLADVDVAGKDCGLDPDSAKSWSESGAEKYLEDWLKTNGEGNWLKELARNHSGGRTVAINCATAETNTCGVTPEPADCDNYEYYFVRLMASRINSAFSHLHERLQSNVIEKALDVSGIAETFKPPEPKESKLEKNLNNIALGPSILSTLVGFAPGGGAASGMLSLFGTAITTAASNLDEKKIEIPSFGEVTSKMDARLKDFFVSTEKELQKSLAAIFGESKERPEDAKKTLSSMIEKMGNAGVEDVNKDSDNPIHEILKGGEWLVPVEDSKIAEAMSKAFSTVQHGLIGNLLNSYQVYVEEELPEAKHKPSGCAQLGTLLEQDRCFVIKRRDDSKSKGEILEEKYLKAFADYGLDIHTLIRNVVECNNDEADTKALRTDGAYPRCYFGMAFARKVHDKDFDRWSSKIDCPSFYRDLDKVPKWIQAKGNGACNHNEIPEWHECKVTFEEDGLWTEGGLDRYAVNAVGDGIDVGQICGYFHDGNRCAGASNRQCYFSDKHGKQRMEINFAKGSGGHESYKTCFHQIITDYADDNLCEKKGIR